MQTDRGDLFDPLRLYDETEAPFCRQAKGTSYSQEHLTPYSEKSTGSDPKFTKDSETNGLPHDPIPRWSPPLLGPLPTFLYATFLILLIIGLEMLNRHSPYSAPSTGMLFIWTYLPVALLMVVEWVWSAYDLQVKILVPWAAMSRDFAPAHKGWLLDYIGSNYFTNLWSAVKYGHIVILLTTLGLWSTAIAGIVTASLFRMENLPRTTAADFLRTTMLDSFNFNTSAAADASYVNSYLGRQLLSLSRPRWTTSDNIVMEAFAAPSSAPTAGTLVAETRGYSAGLTCKPASASYGGNAAIANITVSANTTRQELAFFVDIAAAGCQVTYQLTETEIVDQCLQFVEPCYFGRVYNHTCPGSSAQTTVLAMVAVVNTPGASVITPKFSATSVVECSPTYFQHTLTASVPPLSSSPLTTSIIPGATKTLSVPEWSGMIQWINTTNGLPRDKTQVFWLEIDPWETWGNPALANVPCDCDPWFNLVGHGQNVTYSDFMDVTTLGNVSAMTFTQIFSDLSGSLLVTSAGASAASSVPGHIEGSTSQLVARTVSIRIAQVAIGILLGAVIVVYFLRPRTDLPLDPSSMAAQAFLLRSSHAEISDTIKDTATMTDEETRIVLDDWAFSLENGKNFSIRSQRIGDNAPARGSFKKAPVWRPFILHPASKIALFIIVIGTIIALELSLRRSDANRGFTDLAPFSQDSWTNIAPAYLFVLGVFLASYTFSVSTLEPFFAMHRAPQPARKSVRYSPATRTRIGLIFHALRYQSLVGLSCSAIMLTVPFLKIAVSGLITTTTSPVHSYAPVSVLTAFNTTTIDTLDDRNATVAQTYLAGKVFALSQMEKYDLALPAWSTTGGAVGQVDLGQLGIALGEIAPAQLILREPGQPSNVTITIPLPIMRADLTNCSALAGSDLVILPSNQLQLPIQAMAPDGTAYKCDFNGRTAFLEHENVTLSLPSSPGWFGQIYPPGCGGYVLIYGNTQATNASKIDQMTAVQCLSYNMSMSTQDVTLTYDDKVVNILSIDQTTSRNTVIVDSFPANETGFMANQVLLPHNEANTSLSFDTFIQVLTLKNASVPLSTFLDPTELTAAAQALYTTYWSIYATLNLQINASSGQTAEALVTYSHTRIIQTTGPTRILQALLACILAWGVLTAVLVRKTNYVLTKPPYSIGATMALLADSTLVALPELRWVRNEADLDRLLEPYEFQLGWGSNTQGGSRFGVDIAVKE
ncbi:hypothetical protein B0H10DRAFT_2109910 [Mycena sp. CBHHK59/15]|nr:hypothetical protein B0H10DRAFT_2109910 [Mycena sp. CBHHK59/15]